MRAELQKARKSKKLTQKSVAEHLGIINGAYQKIEYGTRGTSQGNWLKLFELFDKSVPLERLMEIAQKTNAATDTRNVEAAGNGNRKMQ